jgi:8-oxo-dGTP pyrophosphatase MutT (NUDIX family)
LQPKNKKIQPGAGFIIVKKHGDIWKVLGLKIKDKYDLPKGESEIEDNGDPFITAQRECFEECGILISPKNLKWGNCNLKLSSLTLFIAESNQDPVIRKNKKTGIYEHEAAKWLNFIEIENNIINYLSPAIKWARSIIES